jgi:catechol 2,3-dioxygenase-like lactoylglutathione lyase family enzyme
MRPIDHLNRHVSDINRSITWYQDVLGYRVRLRALGFPADEAQVVRKTWSRQVCLRDPDGLEINLIQWTDKQGFYGSPDPDS